MPNRSISSVRAPVRAAARAAKNTRNAATGDDHVDVIGHTDLARGLQNPFPPRLFYPDFVFPAWFSHWFTHSSSSLQNHWTL